MKHIICSTCGVVGSFIASSCGGWDKGLSTLVIFMIIDYISGLVVAGVFRKSKKSKNGALESRAGLKGLFKKGMILVFVLVAYRLDLIMEQNYIRNAVIIGFIINETISIMENAGLMGIPLPNVLNKAIDLLVVKSKKDSSK